MPPLAQIPDPVTAATAGKFLEYGIAGAVIVVLIAAVWFLARHLIECHKGNAAASAASATSIANHAAAMDKVADGMQGIERRLETIERTLERRQ